jgi:hypothetical protein
MSFGKYAVLQEVVHTFEKEPDWTWTIRPVTMNEELAMAKFTSRDLFVVMPDGARVARPITTQEIALREIALTFGGSTIPAVQEAVDAEVDKQTVHTSGVPLLPENAAVDAVEAALRTMPADMVLEIWKAVGEACPPWGPKPKEDEGAPKKAPSKGRKG